MASTVRTDETFMFDRAAETMARDELAALQLRRLQEQIARGYGKVPHFRAKLDAAGVRPEDLRTLADIARFPFTVTRTARLPRFTRRCRAVQDFDPTSVPS